MNLYDVITTNIEATQFSDKFEIGPFNGEITPQMIGEDSLYLLGTISTVPGKPEAPRAVHVSVKKEREVAAATEAAGLAEHSKNGDSKLGVLQPVSISRSRGSGVGRIAAFWLNSKGETQTVSKEFVFRWGARPPFLVGKWTAFVDNRAVEDIVFGADRSFTRSSRRPGDKPFSGKWSTDSDLLPSTIEYVYTEPGGKMITQRGLLELRAGEPNEIREGLAEPGAPYPDKIEDADVRILRRS